MQSFIHKRYQEQDLKVSILDDGQMWFRLREIVQALGRADVDRHWASIVRLEMDHLAYDVPGAEGTFKVITRPVVIALLESEATEEARSFAAWLDRELPTPAPHSPDERLMTQARHLCYAMQNAAEDGTSWDTLADEMQVLTERRAAVIGQAKILFSLGRPSQREGWHSEGPAA